jgi:NAD(P)-dependent dehydrogenase (short-subunit alcohol dehydrogenase family)
VLSTFVWVAGHEGITQKNCKKMVRFLIKIRGRMLFITSLHARTPSLGPAAHYAVAKSGLRTLSRQLAYYYGPSGIRVNSIAPGMIAEDFSPLYEPYARTAALRRIGRPHEIANVAVALLSDRFGSFVTGVDLEVDGGLALSNCMPHSN